LPAADLLGGAASPARDLDQAERAAVQRALARSDGNVSAAAEALGISRATLHRKLRHLDLHRAHYKDSPIRLSQFCDTRSRDPVSTGRQ
jgi:DNA-binding NtrC family response regulator